MYKSIGVITIGQTPRVDMIPAIKEALPPDIRIIEKGALDGKTTEEILTLAPEDGQTTLISRLRSGGSATVAKEKILPIIQQLIDELNNEDILFIILACTGKFPIFKSRVPIIYPDQLLNYTVKGVFRNGPMGVIVPLPDQTQIIIDKWTDGGFQPIVECCSPYDFNETKLIEAVQQLDQKPIHAIVLDCMGYSEKMKNAVKAHTSKPIIISRNMIYRVAAELL